MLQSKATHSTEITQRPPITYQLFGTLLLRHEFFECYPPNPQFNKMWLYSEVTAVQGYKFTNPPQAPG